LKLPTFTPWRLVAVWFALVAPPAFATQTFVNYPSYVGTTSATLSIANVTGTVTKGVATGSVSIDDRLLIDARIPLVLFNPNFPTDSITGSNWYSPAPDTSSTQWISNTFGPTNVGTGVAAPVPPVANTITYTFSQPVTNPRLQILNQDVASISFIQGLPSAPTSATKVSGNSVLVVSGTTVQASSTAVTGLRGGCQNSAGGNAAGICGSVEIPGTYTSLTFRVQVPVSAKDAFLFTFSGDVETIGGTVSGLNTGGSLTLQLVDGAGNVQTVVVNADGTFTFPNGQVAGTSYTAAITSQPAGQICTLSNEAGTVPFGTAVTNIQVVCQSSSTGNVSGTVTAIPTLNQWGMVLLTVLMGLLSVVMPRIRRR
jgi:hypothetical protein